MEPTRFEMEWYNHIITTALKNNDAVLDVDSPKTHIDHIVTLEGDTDRIRDECIYFDLDISYVEDVDEGLSVTLFTGDEWSPVRPEDTHDKYETFYHGMADIFGGNPGEYQLEESWGAERYTRMKLGYWELYKQGDISEEQLREYTKHGPAHFKQLYEPSDSSAFVPLEDV